ncbi:MAG: N,N'-diacetylbacillosaminyl-diphospho-undecaprenol alpha-1,3-N-acetylgalactosaminyltransferase [Nitrospinales bacterium]|jgi:N,N'-diacetylbacillosaminyl-diphospho-undecaprenol alpha-1,3-N-acetylgalactosaminyltransferase
MKIALVATDDFSLLIYRKGLILSLLKLGHEVCLISKPGEFVPQLEKLGARHIPVNLERFINPFNDLSVMIRFFKIFRKEGFDIVHNFTIKPNNYSTLMAYAAGCKEIFNSVTGLGILVYEPWEKSLLSKAFKLGLKLLYALSSRLSNKTWFQNSDDRDYFIKNHLIKPEKSVLIKSSGINLDEWKLPDKDKVASLKQKMGFHLEDILIVMVSRALSSKGIHEFLYTMEQLTRKYSNTKFVLAGGAEENLNRGVPASLLTEKTKSFPFFWLGHQKNIIDVFSIADVIVFPSYYREGVPRCLLEAMALKKPIVTTDHCGCREAVKDGINGFLVPVRDGKAVAEKTELLIQNPELRYKMGNAGLEKARQEFEEKLIVESLLNDLYQFNDKIK